MSDEELKELQEKILEIVEYFDTFCKENDIEYYLMGGSALGAMRHRGFIPWDDDFDVFMDRENYLKFLQKAKKSLDATNFYLQEENTKEYPLFFSKIRMNNTTFIEKDIQHRDMHHGIYIDIMCLNNTVDITPIRYIQYFCARVLSASGIAKQGYITNSKFKKVAIFIAKYLIRGVIKSMLLSIVRAFNTKDTSLVGHFFGRAPFKKTSFSREFLSPPRYVEFNHLTLPVAKNVEDYLTVRYGKNYMDMPSQETKDLYPSHAYIVDTKKSYREYQC